MLDYDYLLQVYNHATSNLLSSCSFRTMFYTSRQLYFMEFTREWTFGHFLLLVLNIIICGAITLFVYCEAKGHHIMNDMLPNDSFVYSFLSKCVYLSPMRSVFCLFRILLYVKWRRDNNPPIHLFGINICMKYIIQYMLNMFILSNASNDMLSEWWITISKTWHYSLKYNSIPD